MDISIIIDKINMKDFPDMITSYFRLNGIKTYNNLRSFYNKLLDYINEDVKNSYLNRILKYLSTESPSVINIIDDFNDGVYDKELRSFVHDLVNSINETNDYVAFYEKINRKITFIFYSDYDEYCEIKTYHNNKDYESFMFCLLKHTFISYKNNLPGIQADRVLKEAFTLNYDTINRNRMIAASAELGNRLAIDLHATHIYKEDIDASMIWLLKIKDSEAALWKLAFEIENNSLKKDTVNIIKQELKSLDLDNEFVDKITVTEKGRKKFYDMHLLYAYKIYYYLATNYHFTKACNSLGKLMIFDCVIYDNDRELTKKIAKQYLAEAIRLGNINAITNISVYSYNNNYGDTEYNKDNTKKLLEVSATLGDLSGNCYYGKMLMDEGNFDKAVEYLKYAADHNQIEACFELGKYYELKDEIDLAIIYYKKAITCKYFDAAYYLAVLYLSNNKEYSHNVAYDYLEKYYDKFTSKVKSKVDYLLEHK